MSRPPLEDIAAAYNEAGRRTKQVASAVQEAFPESTMRSVHRWIRQAKDAGLITVEPVNADVHAVATALGIDPSALQAAILEHADGKIRLRA
jgi:hypothetical protein